MSPELLADIWNTFSDHVPEKAKADIAQEYITILLDYGIAESDLQSLSGIDTYLDTAIEYAIDEEVIEDDDEWDS